MLEFTDYVERNRDLARVARALKRGKDPADAVLGAARWVREHLDLPAGHHRRAHRCGRGVGGAQGVCQDFAHLTLLLVREMGIPARYVSGYLLPSAATEIRQTVRGESHAWIEAWTGGWWGYDPTNDIEIGHRHVWVAVGRDYADVPPLRASTPAGEAAALDVTVDMTRLA